jgi:hypothetical protein
VPPIERAPSIAIVPTPDSQPVPLSKYAVNYIVTDDRMPFRNEYLSLTDVTAEFLQGYMIEAFKETARADLIAFSTEYVTSSFAFGTPINVEFYSTAIFSETSLLPTKEALDGLLRAAFEEQNELDYIDYLGSLEAGNIFLTTTDVTYTAPREIMVSTRSESSSDAKTAGIAAGAVGFALLVAGLAIYKRRNGNEEYYDAQEFSKSKRDSANENMTIAGDTYTGETCDGSLSRDEEQGMVSVDLNGHVDAYDDSSISPAWDGDYFAGNARVQQEESDESEDGSEDDSDDGDNSLNGNEYDEHGSEILNEETMPESASSEEGLEPTGNDDQESEAQDGPDEEEHEIESMAEDLSFDGESEAISFGSCARRPLSIAEVESLLSAELEEVQTMGAASGELARCESTASTIATDLSSTL